MLDEKFVYDQVEVRKTGRMATNTLSSGRVDEVWEITPVDSVVGSWKKWVRLAQLFTIKGQENTND